MVVIYDIFGDMLKEYPNLDTLAGADLSYEDLEYADLHEFDLSDTNFEGAKLCGTEFDSWVFDEANCNAPNFHDTYFEPTIRYGGGGHHKGVRGW